VKAGWVWFRLLFVFSGKGLHALDNNVPNTINGLHSAGFGLGSSRSSSSTGWPKEWSSNCSNGINQADDSKADDGSHEQVVLATTNLAPLAQVEAATSIAIVTKSKISLSAKKNKKYI
jgi:hypothetical protein